MYELYIAGYDCEEISRLNPAFGLGIIVRARVDFDWDLKRQEYLDDLFFKIKEKAQQNQLEAIDFAANGMAVYRKMWNDKFKKFLQTGKEEDLGDFKNISFKTYKEFVELALKLTGQDAKKQVSGEVIHTHKVEKPLKQVTASELLKELDPKK